MKWILIGSLTFSLIVSLALMNGSNESIRILNKFNRFSDSLLQTNLEQTKNTNHCEFDGTASIYRQPDYTVEKSKLAVIWLHGLGGWAEGVFKKLKFYKLPDDQIDFYLPTANKIFTPWKHSGLKNSWFTLDKIIVEKRNEEATRAAQNLLEFVKCIRNNHEKVIVGGTSQGGAVAWLAANIGTDLKNVSFLLANTWLPVSGNYGKEETDINLIYNVLDNVVVASVVKKSIKTSKKMNNVLSIQNSVSLHQTNTTDHMKFIHEFIRNKLS